MGFKERDAVILFIIIIITSLVKLYFSSYIKAPSVMGDEACYIGFANNIASSLTVYKDDFFSKACPCPAGYPLILSVAFIIAPSFYKAIILVGFINALISSITIIPIYLVIRELSGNSREYYPYVAAAISIVPSILTYFYWTMSENLFILVILYIFYFLIRLSNKIDTRDLIIFGFLNFYAVFTREIGISVNIASLISLFFLFKVNKFGFKNALAYFIYYISACLIPWILWILYRQQRIHRITGYRISSYISVLQGFDNLFLRIYFNEILYLFVATYIVFGVLAFWKISQFLHDRNRPVGIFLLLFILSLLLITATHQTPAVRSRMIYYDYDVLGRYVDPVIPLLFILGFLKLFEQGINLKEFLYQGLIASILVFLVFPVNNYKPPNTPAIYYLIYTGINALIFMAIILFFLVVFYLKYPSKRFGYILILVLVVFSIFSACGYYVWHNKNSASYFIKNQAVVKALKTLWQGTQQQNKVIMDIENGYYNYYYSMWMLPAKADVISGEDSHGRAYKGVVSGNGSLYLITDCILVGENPVVVAEAMGNRVYYIPGNVSDVVYICYENFYPVEKWGRWSGDNSSLLIYVPRDSTYQLGFRLWSFHKERNLRVLVNDGLILEQNISTSPMEINIIAKLKHGKNEIGFDIPDSCQGAVDISKSKDKGCLAFAIGDLSIHPI